MFGKPLDRVQTDHKLVSEPQPVETHASSGKIALVVAVIFLVIAGLAIGAQLFPHYKGLDFVRTFFQNQAGLSEGAAAYGIVGLVAGTLGIYLHKKPEDCDGYDETLVTDYSDESDKDDSPFLSIKSWHA